ncbi:MAG: NYN domain-containing protein [Candidatus Kapabacteria bacterium]|nr:NYN domain-containing protein [Candidatus Kapabacteria bacterium]
MNGAILIDAGHFRELWKQRHAPRFQKTQRPMNHLPPATAVVRMIGEIQTAVLDRLPADPVRWIRAYYYDAEPFGEVKTDPRGRVHDFASSPLYASSRRLLDELRRSDHIAVRLGRTKFSEWRAPEDVDGRYSPVFQQKGVDMKIGLDIAWMATKRIVDIIVLVTNDTDFVTPMKLARTEGVVVAVYNISSKPALLLQEHADLVLPGQVPMR